MNQTPSPALPEKDRENPKPASRSAATGADASLADARGVTGQQPRPIVFGEVLFDCFPDGTKTLGGAPFNVACHLAGFGLTPLFISAVGRDTLGEDVRTFMKAREMDTSCLQEDPDHPTGIVDVRFADGEPMYTIQADSAWDYIQPGAIREVLDQHNPGLLYHGSLAIRNSVSESTLTQLAQALEVPIYLDINIRDPWWTALRLESILHRAAWLKLNEKELCHLQSLGLMPRPEPASFNSDVFEHLAHLAGLIVTRGEQGSALYRPGSPRLTGPMEQVPDLVDTVGAGDAMSAVFLAGLLNNWPLDQTLQRAASFAAAICGIRGAVPQDPDFYKYTTQHWTQKPIDNKDEKS